MKILVAIANYGTKNAEYAKQLIKEYRAMPFDVDIVVLCEVSKGFGSDVTEIVGLPTKDPWSLPFGHRKLFVDHAKDYDLFIYTEDDILIREDNILAFLRASECLPENLLPGFLLYELYPDGAKSYPQMHAHYHWVPSSIKRIGVYVCADLSNEHSACYMLNRQQLERAIRSGGFSLSPHRGRYDLPCTASTDPYTQCNFSRVICLSHLPDFELHHLPNVYLNRMSLDEESKRLQVEALFDVLNQKSSGYELFVTKKPIAIDCWDKDYYEPCRADLLELVPESAYRILSVGCGSGETEAYLVGKGKDVTAIPLDSVIGRLAERRGVRILPPDFANGFEALGDERFDAILLPGVLQHLRDPVDVLGRLGGYLNPEGLLVGSVPNLGLIRRLLGHLIERNNKFSILRDTFDDIGLHCTSAPMLRGWLNASKLDTLDISFDKHTTISRFNDLSRDLPRAIVASNLLFVAGH
ncbi:MAG: methyltransferase domain-containing protein [Methylococcaceae bacterium]